MSSGMPHRCPRYWPARHTSDAKSDFWRARWATRASRAGSRRGGVRRQLVDVDDRHVGPLPARDRGRDSLVEVLPADGDHLHLDVLLLTAELVDDREHVGRRRRWSRSRRELDGRAVIARSAREVAPGLAIGASAPREQQCGAGRRAGEEELATVGSEEMLS